MVKQFCLVLLLIVTFSACNDNTKLQEQIDNLEVQSINSYKPGFGEFMSSIQVHHAKLWFAGKNQNWKLADFEVNEIVETLDALQKYQKERKESQALPILHPAIDSVKIAIQLQNPKLFVQCFKALTNTCNTCHQSVNFAFNVVKIPDTPPFSNQDFSVRNK